MPELQKEAEDARKAQQEEQQKEIRSRMPPLNELLNADQMQTAMRGNTEQLTDLFSFLDPGKAAAGGGGSSSADAGAASGDAPDGNALRQPQQVIGGDLKEGKVFRALYSNRQLEEVLVDFWFNHFNVYRRQERAQRSRAAAGEL